MIEKRLKLLLEWISEETEHRIDFHHELKLPLLGWDGGYVEALEDVRDFLLSHKRYGNVFDSVKDDEK